MATIAKSAPSLPLNNVPQRELPSLSLSLTDRLKDLPFDPSAAHKEGNVLLASVSSRSARPRSYVSRMPVIIPRADPDHMPIARPDPSIDFKMLVKQPDVKSAP